MALRASPQETQPGQWQDATHSRAKRQLVSDLEDLVADGNSEDFKAEQPPTIEATFDSRRISQQPSSRPDLCTSSTMSSTPPRLRSKTSTSSISSVSSCATTQTFMSTLSFSTNSEQHARTSTQDLSIAASSYHDESYDEEGADDQLNLDALDMDILTRTEDLNLGFGSSISEGQSNQAPSSNEHWLSSFNATMGHTKSSSQQSSSAATIREQRSAMDSFDTTDNTPSISVGPPSPAVTRRTQSTHLQPHPDPEESVQEMMFASPDYRKSIALSDHSLDPSSPSDRMSSLSLPDAGPQYTNLLRDATMIIEHQRHQDQPDLSILQGEDEVGSEDVAPPDSLHRSSRISETESAVDMADALSRKGTITRSRSRRFSAPGLQGLSYAPQPSVSPSTKPSPQQSTTTQDTGGSLEVTTGTRAPQVIDPNNRSSWSDSETVDDKVYLPGVHKAMVAPGFEGSTLKRPVQPLQHHSTMQTLLSTSIDTHMAGTSSSSSASQNLPHLRHDFRPGVVFEYYEGEWDWLPNFDEMRPDNAGIVGNFMIDSTTEQDLFRPRYTHQVRRQFKEPGNFAVRFTTHIDITQDGVYSFWLSSNDGSVLYVANTLVVENDGIHYATEAEGRILLSVGKHPVTVEFFHKNGKMLEGFRSTGPSLVVTYRAPGPIWSFGLKAGPKKIIKSSNLFYDHGDVRLKNLLRGFEVDDYSSMESGDPLSPTGSSFSGGGRGEHWRQGSNGDQQHSRPSRHRIMSGDMGVIQPSARELHVQMENAKTTIRDLEQIIRDQAESHNKRMAELYGVLQDTQSQVDRLVNGLQKATLFDKPRTTMPIHYNPSTWRGSVASVYVDAQEDYPCQDADHDGAGEHGSTGERGSDSDGVLAKHLDDVEKLKQLYFFSLALSVKMNSEMTGKKTTEYTSTSVQKLYEDCTVHSKIPVEGWPGFVSRHFSRRPTA